MILRPMKGILTWLIKALPKPAEEALGGPRLDEIIGRGSYQLEVRENRRGGVAST